MLLEILLGVAVLSFVFWIFSGLIVDTIKTDKLKRLKDFLGPTVVIICGIIFGLSTIICIFGYGVRNTETSFEYYLKILKDKQQIETQLYTYEEEINNILSGNIEDIDEYTLEQIEYLSNEIRVYNDIVKTHQKDKNGWLFKKHCNKWIVKLPLIETLEQKE